MQLFKGNKAHLKGLQNILPSIHRLDEKEPDDRTTIRQFVALSTAFSLLAKMVRVRAERIAV